MCLTGVDYFSTLGYQPSIAFEAVGLLAPLATIVLVAVTLGCALPVYGKVAEESPFGQGSIAMLERLLSGWTAKVLVLVLLGFAATDFVITKTLSAADAAEHLIHNPFWADMPQLRAEPDVHHDDVAGAARGDVPARIPRSDHGGGRHRRLVPAAQRDCDRQRIVLPRDASGTDRSLVFGRACGQLALRIRGHGWLAVIAACVLFFPKLALGLSGFETGVAVMPLVMGDGKDDPHQPLTRIRNTRKLLATAAIIMSVMLLGSSTITAMLIHPEALVTEGMAQNRALAFIAHGASVAKVNPLFGEKFGTLYDISTVAILWFAGASAMSGLLNLVPRYLPRYGMAPRWAEAVWGMVLVFTFINLLVTWIFGASVIAQGGAYATGVMVLMSSAAVAVVIDQWRKRSGWWLVRVPWLYVVAVIVFFYTTVAIIIEKPDGIKIAGAFIASIIVVSFLSRLQRSKELRFERFDFVDEHSRFLWDALRHLEFPVLVPHRPGHHTIEQKDERMRRVHRLDEDVPIVFVEAVLGDPSEFEQNPLLEVTEEQGRFIVRLRRCVSIAHAVATVALELSKTGQPPEIHFGWSDENPLAANLNFLLFGEGNVPWLVRELIVRMEPDAKKRSRVIIG